MSSVVVALMMTGAYSAATGVAEAFGTGEGPPAWIEPWVALVEGALANRWVWPAAVLIAVAGMTAQFIGVIVLALVWEPAGDE